MTIILDAMGSDHHPDAEIEAALRAAETFGEEIVLVGQEPVLRPKLDISPTMTRVAASQATPACIATYGNSITLTPGTITTRVDGNILTIHALERGGAIDLEEGGMDARVTQFERGR